MRDARLRASQGCDRGQRQLRRFGQARAHATLTQGRGRNRCAEAGRMMLDIYGERFTSRLLLGTAQHPSPTAPKDAVATAQMARELFGTAWIKLEVIANDDTLQPELFGLVEAASILVAEGFKVLPYTTEDLSAAEKLAGAGCTVLMPWASPIGSARGLINRDGLKTLRAYFPETTLIIDAGIGAPSQAAEAMELGYDAVLLNTAVAKAGDPVKMAQAFARA